MKKFLERFFDAWLQWLQIQAGVQPLFGTTRQHSVDEAKNLDFAIAEMMLYAGPQAAGYQQPINKLLF